MTPSDIAVKLSARKIPLPSEVVGNVHTRNQSEIKRGWNRNTVVKILKNETYLGYVRNGTLRKVSYKSKKILLVPHEDWVIKKGMHEPIIDEETGEVLKDKEITMSCILVDDNNISYATGSKTFTIQLMRYLQMQSKMKEKQEYFDIKIIKKKVGNKGNKALSFELV